MRIIKLQYIVGKKVNFLLDTTGTAKWGQKRRNERKQSKSIRKRSNPRDEQSRGATTTTILIVDNIGNINSFAFTERTE